MYSVVSVVTFLIDRRWSKTRLTGSTPIATPDWPNLGKELEASYKVNAYRHSSLVEPWKGTEGFASFRVNAYRYS